MAEFLYGYNLQEMAPVANLEMAIDVVETILNLLHNK